jgi:predicted nucleotidyltransferase
MTDLKQPNIDAATLNTINSFISYVKQRYALDGAVLFGSYARRDASCLIASND